MTEPSHADQANTAHPDEDTPEPAEAEGSRAAAAEAQLAALEEERNKLKDQLLRTLADHENYRRRADREKEDALKYGATQLARDLLTVADNLRRALDNAPRGSDEALTGQLDGVAATERELQAALERRGIRKVDPLGEPFDPNFHQAMFESAESDQPNGMVIQVLQPGYVIHDRLLRPALVGVAKGGFAPKVETVA